MSMTITVAVNGDTLHTVEIVNQTRNLTGVNTYRWWSRQGNSLYITEGSVEHPMEDGAMALVATVTRDIVREKEKQVDLDDENLRALMEEAFAELPPEKRQGAIDDMTVITKQALRTLEGLGGEGEARD